MWRYVFLLVGALVLAASGASTQPAEPVVPVGAEAVTGPPAAGISREELARIGRGIAAGAYEAGPAGACMDCHGMDGRGQAAAGFPRLAGQAENYLASTLADYAEGIRQNDIMTPIAKALTPEQMVAVATYYSTTEAPPLPVEVSGVAGEVLQYGGALAAVGNAHRSVQGCINCHGPEGAGLPPVYPYLAGQTAEYLAAQLRAWKEGTRGGDPLDIMREIAMRLTEEDIRAVSAYYASIRTDVAAPFATGLVEGR